MRYVFLLFLTLVFSESNGQKIEYSIKGEIENKPTDYFAYLVKGYEVFEKRAIIHGIFSFSGQTDTIENPFKAVYLIISKNPDITLEELISKEKNRIWIPDVDSSTKAIVLENISLKFANAQEIKTGKIIQGGERTLLFEAQKEAIRSHKMKEFITAHPNLTLNLDMIEQIVKYYRLAPERAERAFGNIKEMYNTLSDELKQTERGKLLKKQIDELN